MKNKNRKWVVILSLLAILLLIVVPFGISGYFYHANFGNRFETAPYLSHKLSDFDGLQATKHTFASNDEQMLTGYTYFKDGSDKKGVIVLAHGMGGGGHNSYMDVIDYFTSYDYYVFAFDATGNDESQGKNIGGLPQMLIDLNFALDYISQDKTLHRMPKLLWGQSWGGYGVSCILNIRDDIKSVISLSGFNSTTDLIKEQGRHILGGAIDVFVPYLLTIEKIKYGTFSTYTSLNGYENSDARVMIIHSADDEVISVENSFDVYYNRFEEDERFTFIRFEDRGHNNTYYTDASSEYIKAFNETYIEFYHSKNGEMTLEEKTEYMHEHLDRSRAFEIDENLMSKMVVFYDESLK